MSRVEEPIEDLFLVEDSCNVYVLRDEDRGLAIDFGTGRVLDILPRLGIKYLDWVLHTHHHREQCQGDYLLTGTETGIAVPEKELYLFSQPETHWQKVYEVPAAGAHYVRPLRQGINVDHILKPGEDFRWGKYELGILSTPGNSPGGLSFVLKKRDEGTVVFCGDIIMSGGHLHNYYDSEWDYGYGGGLMAIVDSLKEVARLTPCILMPSHGDVIGDAGRELETMIERLEHFIHDLFLRDRDDEDEASAFQVSRETSVDGVRRVLPHVFAGREGNRIGHNWYVIMSDSGRALFVDTGIFRPDGCEWLDRCIARLQSEFGLQGIDAVLISHYHGDHLLQIPHVVEKYGAQVWCYEGFADVIEHPRRYNLAWVAPAYNVPFEGIRVDRLLGDGERLRWEEYEFDIFHLPGQTYYGMGMSGQIDGIRVVFSGDNIFYNRNLSGHDAFVARNEALLEEGYIKCAAKLKELQPDLILGGHAQEIENTGEQIDRFADWSRRFRDALAEFSPYSAYEYLIDPYWVSFYPYQSLVRAGERFSLQVTVRNHYRQPKAVCLSLRAGPGWQIAPARMKKIMAPSSRWSEVFTISVPEDAEARWYGLTADVVFDGSVLGEIFHCLVGVDVDCCETIC